MLLVDRYVQAVRDRLPRGERDDVAAELRETLLSQIEATEVERGARLTEDEVAGMLKRYGAPEVVAARYGARDHLIGPAVYPYYRAVVRVVLWILGSLVAVALVVAAFTAENPAATMAGAVWTGVFITLGTLMIVTLIFARLERMNAHADWAQRWDPRDLLHGAEPRISIPRAETVTALLTTMFWLLWWIDVLPINQWLMLSNLPLAPAPIWDTLTPWIVSLMVANIIVSGVAILRPHWVRLYEAAVVLLDLGIGVVLYRALRAPEYFSVADDRAAGAALAFFNTLVTIGLLAFALLVVVSIGSTARQWILVARRRRHEDAGAVSPLRP